MPQRNFATKLLQKLLKGEIRTSRAAWRRTSVGGSRLVKLYIGVTDKEWFFFLRERHPDEVNFWQPSGGRSFKAIQPGEPFLFKLHSPTNFIVGGGFFVRHTPLPSSLAWEAFGEKNGVPDLEMLRKRVSKYRRDISPADKDPIIGCSLLTEPFFWEESDWIPVPSDWAPNIVQGKTYSTEDPIGADIWNSVLQRRGTPAERVGDELSEARYGAAFLARARLGQGAFRILVTDAYSRRCAITGERTLPVLEAAHIKPYADEGPHRVYNGLLLRSDLHILFDRGYITVTPDKHVEVSRRIREEFDNGRDYYVYHGHELAVLPETVSDQPDGTFLRWHNEHVFSP